MVLSLISLSFSSAQQRPVFSQYMFNPLAINPAFAGSQDQASLSALYRNQWVNLEGAPTISTLTGNTAFMGNRIGVGLQMAVDQIGVHTDFSFYASYAYRIRWQGGVLAMGLQAGFNNLKSDFTQLSLSSINDPNFSGVFQKINPNFGAGLFWANPRMYMGLSVPYLLNSKFFSNDATFSDARSKRYYFFLISRLFDLSPRWQVRPETLIRFQEGAPLGVDLNAKFILDRKYAFGGSYRSGDSMIGTFEFQMTNNLRLGYAYEHTLSALQGFTYGSHEIMLNWRMDLPTGRGGVECPSYF
jgi:type IX secretion system PorP/SprF family membrane protein